MRLTKQGNKYVAVNTTYKDTSRLGKEGARFAWDKTGNKTGTAGAWWTAQIEKAAKLIDFADDSCRDELQTYLEFQTSRVYRSRAARSDAQVRVPPGISVYPYQRGGVELLLETPRALLADQMGLGKTPMCLFYLNGLVGGQGGREASLGSSGNGPASVLVLCPASLRLNWRDECARFLVDPWRVSLLDSKSDLKLAREWTRDGGRSLFICSPEALTQKSNYKVSADAIERGPVDAFVHEVKWDVLIADEAHMYKNPTAKRTIGVFGRAGIPPRSGKNKRPGLPPVAAIDAERVVLVTGTPYPNCPIEVQPLAGFLHPEFADYWAFAAKYCDMKRTRFGMDVKGASNLNVLQERLRSTIMIRRTKDEVLDDLPPKIRQVIDLPGDGMAKYIKAEQASIKQQIQIIQKLKTLTSSTVDRAKWSQAVKLLKNNLQVSFRDLSKLRAETAIAKVDRCADFIQDQLDSGAIHKLGIFGHHRAVIDALHQRFKDYGAVKLYGGMSQDAKHASVNAFQSDPNCRVFIGSIGAAGVGLTLTAASDVFFVELDWVPGNMDQAEDRFHRVTQKNTVFVRHLVVDGTIDCKMAHRLVEKQKNIEAGLDDDRALDSLFGLGYDDAINYSDQDLDAIHMGLTQVIQE